MVFYFSIVTFVYNCYIRILLTFVNIIVTWKNTYSYWFIIISSSSFSEGFLLSLIIISLIPLFSFSSLKTFLMSLIILALIAIIYFSILEVFVMFIIVVPIIYFFSFSNVKNFLISLIIFSFSKLGLYIIICCEKK